MEPSTAEKAQILPSPPSDEVTGEPASQSPTELQRRRFVAQLERLAPVPGRSATSWPGLRCYRAPQPTSPDPTIYTPSLCIVAQGMKEAALGDRVVRYDPFNYLVIGAHLPVRATVLEASPERPFLSLVLDIEASAVLREIVYLALRGEQGDLLRAAVRGDSRSLGVERALRYIHRHHAERLDVPSLAREAGMSTSTLHHRFKAATSLTPIQYLKRMRLHRARQLMVDEGCLAAEAAFRVGYESPSQFSRDFKRHFGSPPRRYVEGWDLPSSSARQEEVAALSTMQGMDLADPEVMGKAWPR
jgi:AraC-like DNA-binding protein